MSLINCRIASTGVNFCLKGLIAELTQVNTIGAFMQNLCASTWVDMIRTRLFENQTSTSNYSRNLDSTMWQLDPEFVEYLGGGAWSVWANKTEAERRGYEEGTIVPAISMAISASPPIMGAKTVFVGVGHVETLNKVFSYVTKDSKFKIWQILNYGEGSKAGLSDIVRGAAGVDNPQIFYDGKTGGHITGQTVNPGFRGREFLVQMDGTIIESDRIIATEILSYIDKSVRKYSFK